MCCRITGGIPTRWADPTSFQKLRTLNLANNGLTGTLPVWEKRYSWRTLEKIDLSNNYFTGERDGVARVGRGRHAAPGVAGGAWPWGW